MSRKYSATADYLAEELSRKTGTDFQVLRGRPLIKVLIPGGFHPTVSVKPGPMRYSLKATRRAPGLKVGPESFSHVFQSHRPMTLGELTRWLASLCDMVDMGFIPADPHRSGPATRARENE